MINYYIPDFFWHYNVNMQLMYLIKNEPQMFYDDFKIGAVFGNFPNCIWNGGGTTQGRFVDVSEQQGIMMDFLQYDVPLRLTMTNLMIEEKHLQDSYCNYIMENLDNGITQVLVSNPILEKYIRETYPNYPIVRSILAAENIYYDDSDKYFMTVLRKHKNNDFDLLNSIEHKEKDELLANETCEEDCPRAYTHYLEFAKQQMYQNNKGEILHTECSYDRRYNFQKFVKSPLCITRDKIKEVYEPMGFQHFKISGRGSHGSVVNYYAHYMVKPEWTWDFMSMMMDSIVADNR